MFITKLRSIFTVVTGSSRRTPMELYPVPKSSRATLIPRLRSLVKISFSRAISKRRQRSVISRHRFCGGYFSSSRMAKTLSTKSGFSSCVYERFTFITKPGQESKNFFASLIEDFKIHLPNSGNKLSCSKTSTNSTGGTTPYSSFFQRIKDSAPITFSVLASTIGW